jgi:PhoPQ-activated pathogenicity-related protein
MVTSRKYLLPVLLLFLLVGLVDAEAQHIRPSLVEHPMAQALAVTDEAFDFEVHEAHKRAGYTTYVVRMVSQHWTPREDVSEQTWWHWVTIVVPDDVTSDAALLWLGGGSRTTSQPSEAEGFLRAAALETSSVAIGVHNIPSQPLSFEEDSSARRLSEDALIAYGWRQYLEGGAHADDIEWLARVPMTRAAMRAMDTATTILEDRHGTALQRFVVSGASKRGWTAWTTGIFDARIVAMAPAVIDVLNLRASFTHHWKAYGEWSPAISDYEEEGIMDWKDTAEFAELEAMVDPYAYLDDVEIPVYVVNASSDEFFLPDSWQFYWDAMPEASRLRYVPNTGHSMAGTDAVEGLLTFYAHIVDGRTPPNLEWQVQESSIRIRIPDSSNAESIRLWSASNEVRDFRHYVVGEAWEATELSIPDGEASIPVEIPDDGYAAYFVEVVFGTDAGMLPLTSGIKVVPDTYAYDDYTPRQRRSRP